MLGLKYIMNRVNVWIIYFRKDEVPLSYGYGFKRKGGTYLQEWEAEGLENVGRRPGYSPCIIVFRGYGVVAKCVDLQNEIIRKVQRDNDFLWWEEKEQKKLHFMRKAQAVEMLDRWEKIGVPVADVQVKAGNYNMPGSELQLFLQQTASGFLDGISRQSLFLHPGRQGHVLANLAYRRLKLPTLVLLFVLLAVNYPLQRHFQEEKARQQMELKALQQQDHARQSVSQKNRALMQEFRRLKDVSICRIADRVAAAVPTKVRLQCLAVQPISGRIEEKKDLRVQSQYVYVEGYAARASEVTLYTEHLAKTCPEWKVRLLSLEKKENGNVFKIGIQL